MIAQNAQSQNLNLKAINSLLIISFSSESKINAFNYRIKAC